MCLRFPNVVDVISAQRSIKQVMDTALVVSLLKRLASAHSTPLSKSKAPMTARHW
jgi:hypothetical protein